MPRMGATVSGSKRFPFRASVRRRATRVERTVAGSRVHRCAVLECVLVSLLEKASHIGEARLLGVGMRLKAGHGHRDCGAPRAIRRSHLYRCATLAHHFGAEAERCAVAFNPDQQEISLVNFSINGRAYEMALDPRTSLLDLL